MEEQRVAPQGRKKERAVRRLVREDFACESEQSRPDLDGCGACRALEVGFEECKRDTVRAARWKVSGHSRLRVSRPIGTHRFRGLDRLLEAFFGLTRSHRLATTPGALGESTLSIAKSRSSAVGDCWQAESAPP